MEYEYVVKYRHIVIVKGFNPKQQPCNLIIPNYITVGNKRYPVTEIAEDAFKELNIQSVLLPMNLKNIGPYAFKGNALREITIPNKVTVIQHGVFADNNLTKVTLPASLKN